MTCKQFPASRLSFERFLQPLLLLALVHLLPPPAAVAQRNVTYQELVQQSEQPQLYTSYLLLPGTGEPLFLTGFRMEYDLLTFRRQEPEPGREIYTSAARINMELFRQTNGNRQSAGRSTWADTARADTYEQTRSRMHYLEGAISRNLAPGSYSLSLDLIRSDSPGTPGFNRRSSGRNSSPRTGRHSFSVPDFETREQGTLVLIDSVNQKEGQYQAKLLNFGNFSPYGQDYELLIQLPASHGQGTYTLKAERLRPGSDSETTGDILFEEQLAADDFHRTRGFSHPAGNRKPLLVFSESEEGYPVMITSIPAAGFPNASYRLALVEDGSDDPIAETVVHSRWADMPASLLNLNVAIDMLRFIVDDEQLREIRSGSTEAKMNKFSEFWSRRDPTPGTEYNELMTEFYRRIDQAWQQFTTPERPGYESDQGRAHILYGPPDRKERTYPVNGPTREIWIYSNRTLIFEATTGFGDFRLVEQR